MSEALHRAGLRAAQRSALRPVLRQPALAALASEAAASLEQLAVGAAQRNGASLWYVPQSLVGVFQNSDASGAPGVGSPVGYMAAQVGSAPMTQPTTANKPLLQLASGQYVLQFDGTNDFMTCSLSTGSSGMYIAAFVPGAVLARGILGNGGAAVASVGAGLGTTASSTVRLARSDGTTTTPLLSGGTYSANSPSVACGQWDGTNGALRVGGVQVASGVGPASASAAVIALGAASASGGGAWTGSIALACYCPALMPDADRNAIERFAASLIGAPYV